MNLIKELTIDNMVIKIYSINPNLVIDNDVSVFQNKNDIEIQHIVFDEIGAEQVDIYEMSGEGLLNQRSYAII